MKFSPSGTRVLSGSADGTLKLWDTAAGRPIRTFRGHIGEVLSVAYSPDGKRLLSGSWDGDEGTLKLWDADTGRLIRTFEGPSGVINSVAFSPDGTRALSGSWDRTLKLWNAVTGRLIRNFERHTTKPSTLAFAPGSTHVLTSDEDGVLDLWDAATGQLVRTFEGRGASVAFSPDGARMVGRNDEKLKLWDAATGRLIRTFEGPFAHLVSFVMFLPNSKHVVTCNQLGEFELWDADTGHVTRTFEGRMNGKMLALSPDATHGLFEGFPAGGSPGTLLLWDAAAGRLVRTFENHAGGYKTGAFSPDGTRVLSGGNGGELKLWDADTGQLIRTFEGHSAVVNSVAFSSDGTRVLSGSWDGTLKLWRVDTGQLIHTFGGHTGGINSAALSSDGHRIASASADSTTRIWDTQTGAQLAILVGKRDGNGLALTPAGFFAGPLAASDVLAIVRGLAGTTVNQVHQSLFNPDLVREALAGDPNAEVRKAAEVINLEKVLDSGPAPSVAIASPAEGSRSAAELVEVKARIEDRGKGIGRIEWRVNGVTAAIAAGPSAGGGPVYAPPPRKLALDPGDNIVEVIAYNGSNLLASLPARTTVKFTGPADKAKPQLHVLAIGINKYVDKGWTSPGASAAERFKPLSLAADDANAVAEMLKKASGSLYADVKVTLLVDEEAYRDGVERAVIKMASEILPRDTFIFFAAAHGISEKGRFYLIPQDYQSGPGALARNAIGQDRLQNWFANRIRAKKALVLLDTCESGALVAGHTRSRTDSPASEAAIGRLHEATGRPVLTAAALGQDAWEGVIAQTGDRHGVFTWALLDALRLGDINNDGSIDLSELATHVQSRVTRAELKGPLGTTLSLAGRQSARFGSRGENFVIARRLQ